MGESSCPVLLSSLTSGDSTSGVPRRRHFRFPPSLFPGPLSFRYLTARLPLPRDGGDRPYDHGGPTRDLDDPGTDGLVFRDGDDGDGSTGVFRGDLSQALPPPGPLDPFLYTSGTRGWDRGRVLEVGRWGWTGSGRGGRMESGRGLSEPHTTTSHRGLGSPRTTSNYTVDPGHGSSRW